MIFWTLETQVRKKIKQATIVQSNSSLVYHRQMDGFMGSNNPIKDLEAFHINPVFWGDDFVENGFESACDNLRVNFVYDIV
jgi:hypothetical protein